MQQTSLFDSDELGPDLLPGLLYEPDFLDHEEEAFLIGLIGRLPLVEARYKGFVARRRVLSFGGAFDYDSNTLGPAPDLIEELRPLRDKVARWAGLAPAELGHALLAHYPLGAPLGWHRDVPEFETVFGVSLGAPAVLRFRPYPPVYPKPTDIKRLVARPRSIYAMKDAARWAWQHSVAAVDAPRSSITLRTFCKRRP